MFIRFLNFEVKQFFRSAFWQKGIVINIIMGLFALWIVLSFLGLGLAGYPILKELFPEKDPFQVVNGFLLFYIIGDLIFRYLMQKLPVMNIKPLLILDIKKSKLINYTLIKSGLSFFNFFSLFFFIPFSFVLIKEGYLTTNVLSWLTGIIAIIFSVNYLNFITNKSNIAFGILVAILGSIITLQQFGIYDFTQTSISIFNSLYNSWLFVLVPVALLIIFYFINYKKLASQLYLDDAIQLKTKEAKTSDLSFVDKFGDLAPFMKNEMRLIWRNKRTKMVFFMSFIFLFYGLIFFTNDVYAKNPSMLIFAALFVTGGFALNYGQFIPAWDSEYYKMIMSQNIRYRRFLESKWLIMSAITFVLYILSIPYLYLGIDKFLMISAGAIFNIGFNSLFLLWAGSFNRKRIDLDASGFGNTQGTSATQFLIVLPLMGFPMILFFAVSKFLGFNAGVLAIASFGVLGILLKNPIMNLIEKKYIKDKYATIHGFSQKK